MIDQSEVNPLGRLFDKYLGGGINIVLTLKANRTKPSDVQVNLLYKPWERAY